MQLAGGGVGGFDQHEQALFAVPALFQEGLNAVRAEVAVYRYAVAAVGRDLGIAYAGLAEVGFRVSRGGCADVVALDIADDVHALGVGVVDGFLERHRAVGAKQLVIRRLRLDRGHDVAQCVDQPAVEGDDALRRCAQRFAVQHHMAHGNVLGDVLEAGVQPGNGRVALFLDFFYQCLDRHKCSSFLSGNRFLYIRVSK